MMTFFNAAALLAASLQPAPVDGGRAQLPQEHAAMLRCSAAFALVSYGQANGDEAVRAWPRIDPRGREFFVRSLAKIIDDTGMTREQASQMAKAEAQRLIDNNLLDNVMPGCLLMLDASGV